MTETSRRPSPSQTRRTGETAKPVVFPQFPFRLVLGSRSPRRRELLTNAGYRFDVLPADDEAEAKEPASSDPVELVSRLAFVKARNVVEKLRRNLLNVPVSPVDAFDSSLLGDASSAVSANGAISLDSASAASSLPRVVVSCDSVACCKGEILGKPRDRADAERMLRLLSGSKHSVRTGLCLWAIPGDVVLRRVETSTLVMRPLSEALLAEYLASGLWVGKAGAFGYQDGNDWLRLESGSESNVVGLPLEALAESLAEMVERLKSAR